MVNHLKPGVHLNSVKFSCFLTEKICFFIVQIIWLKRVREVVTAYCENHTEYITYTVYAKRSILLKLRQVLH